MPLTTVTDTITMDTNYVLSSHMGVEGVRAPTDPTATGGVIQDTMESQGHPAEVLRLQSDQDTVYS